MFTSGQPVGLVQWLGEAVRGKERVEPAIERQPGACQCFVPRQCFWRFAKARLDVVIELFANALDLGSIQRCGRCCSHDYALYAIDLKHAVVIWLRDVSVVKRQVTSGSRQCNTYTAGI